MRLRRAARRCRSQARDLLSQPLWSCCSLNEYFQSMIKCNAKAAATAGHERERVTATRCAAEGCISVISVFFPNVSKAKQETQPQNQQMNTN